MFYVSAFVFHISLSLCVHFSYLCLCVSHISAFVFHISLCLCVHVSYLCVCVSHISAFVFHISLCLCFSYLCLCVSLHISLSLFDTLLRSGSSERSGAGSWSRDQTKNTSALKLTVSFLTFRICVFLYFCVCAFSVHMSTLLTHRMWGSGKSVGWLLKGAHKEYFCITFYSFLCVFACFRILYLCICVFSVHMCTLLVWGSGKSVGWLLKGARTKPLLH